MAIQGSGLKDPNVRLRFLFLIFMGIAAFASVAYWRTKTINNAEYVDLSGSHKNSALYNELHSDNYQIEVRDSSPSIK